MPFLGIWRLLRVLVALVYSRFWWMSGVVRLIIRVTATLGWLLASLFCLIFTGESSPPCFQLKGPRSAFGLFRLRCAVTVGWEFGCVGRNVWVGAGW